MLFLLLTSVSYANYMLVPMDERQSNHLKAYGIAYLVLKDGLDLDWLLNYRGGSYLIKYVSTIEKECRVRGVSYETISDAKSAAILAEIAVPENNMEAVKLHVDNG